MSRLKSRRSYTEIEIADMATRLRELPPKQRTTVGVADVVSALRRELKSVLDRGYTLEEAVEILNQPEDRGLRASTVRRYFATGKKGGARTIPLTAQT